MSESIGADKWDMIKGKIKMNNDPELRQGYAFININNLLTYLNNDHGPKDLKEKLEKMLTEKEHAKEIFNEKDMLNCFNRFLQNTIDEDDELNDKMTGVFLDHSTKILSRRKIGI